MKLCQNFEGRVAAHELSYVYVRSHFDTTESRLRWYCIDWIYWIYCTRSFGVLLGQQQRESDGIRQYTYVLTYLSRSWTVSAASMYTMCVCVCLCEYVCAHVHICDVSVSKYAYVCKYVCLFSIFYISWMYTRWFYLGEGR